MSLLAGVVVGVGIYLSLKFIPPSGAAKTPVDLGRGWLAWGCVLALVTGFNSLMQYKSVGGALGFTFAALIFFAPISFSLGWLYGRLFKFDNSASASPAIIDSLAPSPPRPQPAAATAFTAPSVTPGKFASPIQPAPATVTSSPSPVSVDPSQFVIDEDAIYEQVANEIESGNARKGLWTKLWAELDGDDSKVKLAYIKTRVSQIITEQQGAQRVAAEIHVQRQREAEEFEKTAAIENERNRLNEISALSRRIESGKYSYGDEQFRLLELMGGSFEWTEAEYSEQCRARYLGQYHEFPDGRVCRKWINESVLPDAQALLVREFGPGHERSVASADDARVLDKCHIDS